MNLRIKKNLLATLWKDAVNYRQWQFEALEIGGFKEANTWQRYFEDVLEHLHNIVTDDYCTLHDMATFEAQARIKVHKDRLTRYKNY